MRKTFEIDLSEPSDQEKEISQLASELGGTALANRTARALHEDGITSMEVMIRLLRILGREKFKNRIRNTRNVGEKSLFIISAALNHHHLSGRAEETSGLPPASLARLLELNYQFYQHEVMGEELLFPGLENWQGEECGATVHDFRLLMKLLSGF